MTYSYIEYESPLSQLMLGEGLFCVWHIGVLDFVVFVDIVKVRL